MLCIPLGLPIGRDYAKASSYDNDDDGFNKLTNRDDNDDNIKAAWEIVIFLCSLFLWRGDFVRKRKWGWLGRFNSWNEGCLEEIS